jgi:hypothetical protein
VDDPHRSHDDKPGIADDLAILIARQGKVLFAMKIFPLSLAVLMLLITATLAGCTTSRETGTPADANITTMEVMAKDLSGSINAGLTGLENSVASNSKALSTTGLSGPGATAVLDNNLLRYPWALSSLMISKDGVVMAAAPKNYEHVVGMNLSWQTQVQYANSARVPIVSGVFRMVEGFNGISQSYPVYSQSGEYLGYTDITYEPEMFLGRYIENATAGTEYDVWVAQADGTEIYDTTKEEIGKNILSDPAYADPVLHEVLVKITGNKSGTAKYTFYNKDWNQYITKLAAWDTAGIDGAEWRVVVTRPENASSAQIPVRPAADLPVESAIRAANLTRYVESAVTYASEKGKDAALREFNNANGTFIQGDLYVFAYDMNGTVLALPYQQGLLGTNRMDITDSNDVKFIARMTDIARGGGGFVYYVYPNPADGFQDELKLTYVIPVDKTWFVGAGSYFPSVKAKFSPAERDALAEQVKQARIYAQTNGKDKALNEFDNPKGIFSNGNRYISAYDYNGTVLAMPYQPEMVGQDRKKFTEFNESSIVPWDSSVAESGGGFIYIDYSNPFSGKSGIKLCYVAPVDKQWFVGAGIPIQER